MSRRPKKITFDDECDLCDSRATQWSSVLKYAACDACASQLPDGKFRPIEVWICEHTKKCGWQGQHHDLLFMPDPEDMKMEHGCCPRCGGEVFFVCNMKGESV